MKSYLCILVWDKILKWSKGWRVKPIILTDRKGPAAVEAALLNYIHAWEKVANHAAQRILFQNQAVLGHLLTPGRS